MTISDAAHELYLRYQDKYWLTSIGVAENDGRISIFLQKKPFGNDLDELRLLKTHGYQGYRVEVRIVGAVRFCNEDTLS
jgi:hypothetical protein